MTPKPTLTLEALAALDEAASRGPLATNLTTERRHRGDGSSRMMVRVEPRLFEPDEQHLAQADMDLMNATKGTAPRLLAALRGLADEWEFKTYAHIGAYERGKATVLENCAAQLRTLLETLDLAGRE